MEVDESSCDTLEETLAFADNITSDTIDNKGEDIKVGEEADTEETSDNYNMPLLWHVIMPGAIISCHAPIIKDVITYIQVACLLTSGCWFGRLEFQQKPKPKL